MSLNREKPHILVLPEDDANRELANGFYKVLGLDVRRMQVVPVAGGWLKVLDRFREDHLVDMRNYRNQLMVLLIDFDQKEDRLNLIQAEIPEDLRQRVFVLGTWTNPEELRGELGPLEEIGLGLARDCQDQSDEIWSHELLRHNAGELTRLRREARPILFQNL